MADDVGPAIAQAAALMSGTRIASIRAKGVGFRTPDGYFDHSDAFRIVGMVPGQTQGFYLMEDAINHLLRDGYRLLPEAELESWTLSLNMGKELKDMSVNEHDGNICVAVFGKEAVSQIAATLESQGKGLSSPCPTAQLTASILAASARYNLSSSTQRQQKCIIVSLVRQVAADLDDSIAWFVHGLEDEDKKAAPYGVRFQSHEDAFNYMVDSGCVPFGKELEELWKRIIWRGMELVGEEPNETPRGSTWPYVISGEVLNVFFKPT
jgi:hypothetical protein